MTDTRPAPVCNYAQIVAWIRDHGPDSPDSPEEQALWFWSYQAAALAVECNRTKDWAYLYRHGLPATTPETVDEDCADLCAIDEGDELLDLTGELREFFLDGGDEEEESNDE